MAVFSSEVIYKKYIKGWITGHQIFCQILYSKLVERNKFGLILFSKNLFSRTNLLKSSAIMALKCDRR